jgi:hypothetical protein
MGRHTTAEEIETVLGVLPETVEAVRRITVTTLS